MFSNVKNAAQLIANGEKPVIRKLRRDILHAVDKAVEAVKPFNLLRDKVRLSRRDRLVIAGYDISLSGYSRIAVMAFGKASLQMTQFITNLLKDYRLDGIVVTPHGTAKSRKIDGISVLEAGHPIPDEKSVEAAERIVELAKSCDEKTLVLVLISGGGSALLSLPAGDLTLQDKIITTEELLKAGASIHEINAVRKHISAIKGGQLAGHLCSSRVISLIISDVVATYVDVIASGPTAPDNSTYEDALHILRKYKLIGRIPESVVEHLKRGAAGAVPETPKPSDTIFRRVSNIVVGNVYDACKVAADSMRRQGYRTAIVSTYLMGEAREIGKVITGIAGTIARINSPVKRPAALVFGGETTVTVRGEGKGGRNQELALAVAIGMSNLKDTVFISLGTDGVDGPTEAAGALSDHNTLARATEKGMDAEDFLLRNDSNTFFKKLGDVVLTGYTGTNVGDICILTIR